MCSGPTKKKSYDECDAPHPVMQYARSKYLGEQNVRWLSRNFILWRISWLFGKHRKQLRLQMIDSITHNKSYSAVLI